jgi:hypothetical protein
VTVRAGNVGLAHDDGSAAAEPCGRTDHRLQGSHLRRPGAARREHRSRRDSRLLQNATLAGLMVQIALRRHAQNLLARDPACTVRLPTFTPSRTRRDDRDDGMYLDVSELEAGPRRRQHHAGPEPAKSGGGGKSDGQATWKQIEASRSGPGTTLIGTEEATTRTVDAGPFEPLFGVSKRSNRSQRDSQPLEAVLHTGGQRLIAGTMWFRPDPTAEPHNASIAGREADRQSLGPR